MSEVSTQEHSLEVVKAGFQVELQRKGFNELKQRLANVKVSEDNLPHISAILKETRELKKIVDTKHTELKAPHLREGQKIDKAKREYYALIDEMAQPVIDSYNKVCLDVENRRRLQEEERKRVANIKGIIEGNILYLSQEIAKCDTASMLTQIESRINLLKGAAQNKSKYEEFLPDWLEKLSGLAALITEQKKHIRKLEKINKKVAEATDEMGIMELHEEAENLRSSIDENKIKVQEQAIDAATNADVEVAEEILPQINARRTSWKYEVLDIKLLQKKMPHLVKLVADEEKIDDLLKTEKAKGIPENTDEFNIAGIRFYKQKTF